MDTVKLDGFSEDILNYCGVIECVLEDALSKLICKILELPLLECVGVYYKKDNVIKTILYLRHNALHVSWINDIDHLIRWKVKIISFKRLTPYYQRDSYCKHMHNSFITVNREYDEDPSIIYNRIWKGEVINTGVYMVNKILKGLETKLLVDSKVILMPLTDEILFTNDEFDKTESFSLSDQYATLFSSFIDLFITNQDFQHKVLNYQGVTALISQINNGRINSKEYPTITKRGLVRVTPCKNGIRDLRKFINTLFSSLNEESPTLVDLQQLVAIHNKLDTDNKLLVPDFISKHAIIGQPDNYRHEECEIIYLADKCSDISKLSTEELKLILRFFNQQNKLPNLQNKIINELAERHYEV